MTDPCMVYMLTFGVYLSQKTLQMINLTRLLVKINYWLVVFRHPSEKYTSESQLGWWSKPNISGKIKLMATSHHQPDINGLAGKLTGWSRIYRIGPPYRPMVSGVQIFPAIEIIIRLTTTSININQHVRTFAQRNKPVTPSAPLDVPPVPSVPWIHSDR